MDPRFQKRLMAARADLADVALKGQVEAKRFVEPQILQVALPVLDLFDAPYPLETPAEASRGSQLLLGEDFAVLEQNEETGWAWGQAVRDGYMGYVHLHGLERAMTGSLVTARASHVYPEPNFKSVAHMELPFGARIRAADSENRFRQTELGFVPEQHLDQPLGADFVAVAELFIGTPYLWGGRSSFGMDCSGIVQTALHAIGQDAPRDSDMQEAMLGEALPEDAPLARGDLIFWKGHVGIMSDSDMLLHANTGAMAVAYENFRDACARIKAAGDGPVTSRKRLT